MRKRLIQACREMKCLLFILTLYLGTAVRSFGQDEFISSEYFENLIPSTSTPGTLGNFGDVPINYYTGLPEVSLPLFTLQSRELSLPVSMDYDATGVRLDEISGPVGLKWNLNIGGYVTRIMNGLPDETPNNKGYFWASQQSNNFSAIPDLQYWVYWSGERTLDTQPDEFILSIPGRSIKFVIYNSQIYTIPRQNVNLTYTMNAGKIHSFVLVTEDGTEYTFGNTSAAIERRKIETLNHDVTKMRQSSLPYYYYRTAFSSDLKFEEKPIIDEYNSKWLLLKIKSPTSDMINFNYSALPSVKYASRPITTEAKQLDASYPNPVDGQIDFYVQKFTQQYLGGAILPAHTEYTLEEQEAHVGGITLNHSLITDYPVSLNTVVASNGSQISIVGNTTFRQDLPSAFIIDELKLFNQNSQLIKHYKFNYAHQQASEVLDPFSLSEAIMITKPLQLVGSAGSKFAGDYKDAYSNNSYYTKYVAEGLKSYNFKRLFLESIDEVDVGLSTWKKKRPSFSFIYNSRDQLRRRTSPLASAYGYQVTGSSGNAHVMGQGYEARYVGAWPTAGSGLGYPLFGTLERIVYPTGGYTQFNYQAPSPFLTSVKDYKAPEVLSSMKRLVYLDPPKTSGPVSNKTYQEFKRFGYNDYLWFEIKSSQPIEEPQRSNGAAVFGTSLVQVFSDEDGSNGSEIFQFTSWDDAGDEFPAVYCDPKDRNPSNQEVDFVEAPIFPFRKPRDKSYLRGRLLKYAAMDANGDTVRSVKNYYKLNPNYTPFTVRGINGARYLGGGEKKKNWLGAVVAEAIWKHRYSYVKHQTDWYVLDKTLESVKDDSAPQNSMSKVISYSYDPISLQMIESKTSLVGAQESVISKTKYVTHSDYNYSGTPLPDASTEAILTLRNKHQINTPIETQTIVEENGVTKLVNAMVYKYGVQAVGLVKTKEIWATNRQIDATAFATSAVGPYDGVFYMDNVLGSPPKLRRVHTFNSYDTSNGNLLQQTSLDDIISIYTWGYSNSLVTAFTVNPLFSDKQVFQFQHKPGVGVTQKSDPNARNENFEFDDFNRLKLTRDHDNNIVQRLSYHYANAEELVADYGFTVNLSNNLATYSATTNVPPGTRYVWDFGDGVINENGGTSPSHTYSGTGNYSVCLALIHPEFPVRYVTKTVVVPTITSIISTNNSTYRLIDICPSPQPLTSGFSASVSGSGNWSFQWEYKPTSNSNWTNVSGGTSQSITWGPAGASSGSGYNLRCKLMGDAGYKYSNTVTVEFYCSNPGGGGGGGGCTEQCTYQQQQEGCYTLTSSCTCVCP